MADLPELKVSDLDFNTIKQNLKDFLRSKPEFKDYDFEASGLSALLNILAYNTHYNGFYANLALNETFLDSAQRRSAIVSRAKELNYLPSSAAAPVATVDITVTPASNTSPPFYITLYRGTEFKTTVGTTSYNYTINENVDMFLVDGEYNVTGLEIREGKARSYQYTISDGERYIIPDANVDLSTLKVYIKDSALSANKTPYSFATNLLPITGDSKVYWLYENEQGNYEIQFGDDVIGTAPAENTILYMEYIVTNGPAGNGATTFKIGNTLSQTIRANYVVTTTSVGQGGTFKESSESVRKNAPLWYSAQERAVTESDYRVLIQSQFPYIRSLSVWGGETNDPILYGRVLYSAIPNSGASLSDVQIATINTYLDKYNMVSIIPEYVVPEYIDVYVTANFVYDATLITTSQGTMIDQIRSYLLDYFATELIKFNNELRLSNITSYIDKHDTSILSSDVSVKLRTYATPTLGQSQSYIIQFVNPLVAGTILSSGVSVNQTTESLQTTQAYQYFVDDENGNIDLYEDVSGIPKLLKNGIGSVDYTTGKITIPSIRLDAIEDVSQFHVDAKPSDSVIYPKRNKVLRVPNETDSLTISARIENQQYTDNG